MRNEASENSFIHFLMRCVWLSVSECLFGCATPACSRSSSESEANTHTLTKKKKRIVASATQGCASVVLLSSHPPYAHIGHLFEIEAAPPFSLLQSVRPPPKKKKTEKNLNEKNEKRYCGKGIDTNVCGCGWMVVCVRAEMGATRDGAEVSFFSYISPFYLYCSFFERQRRTA